jgi:hypothetical protein
VKNPDPLYAALDHLYQILPPEAQNNFVEQDRREAELSAVLKTNCLDAIEMIVSAARHPRISLADLESAIAMLTVARDCAKALEGQ